MDAENPLVDDRALLQDHPIDIGDRRAATMGRDPLGQLVDVVERVAADCIVHHAEICRQEIRINSRGICRGKTRGIEKNFVADIV
jgi:hypothetical protein